MGDRKDKKDYIYWQAVRRYEICGRVGRSVREGIETPKEWKAKKGK